MLGIGLKPWEFWNDTTLRDCHMMLEGFQWREEQRQGRTEQVMGAIRINATIQYNANQSKGKQTSPQKLFPLPSEEQGKPKFDPDRAERIRKKAEKLKNVKGTPVKRLR